MVRVREGWCGTSPILILWSSFFFIIFLFACLFDSCGPNRDTAGQERFRTITTAYYRGAMGILLVYDITNEKSFDSIRNWIRNIEEHASADVERMLVGNKCDMNDKRQVSKERGEKVRVHQHFYMPEHMIDTDWCVFVCLFGFAVSNWIRNEIHGNKCQAKYQYRKCVHHTSQGYQNQDRKTNCKFFELFWNSCRILFWFSSVLPESNASKFPNGQVERQKRCQQWRQYNTTEFQESQRVFLVLFDSLNTVNKIDKHKYISTMHMIYFSILTFIFNFPHFNCTWFTSCMTMTLLGSNFFNFRSDISIKKPLLNPQLRQ